MNFKCSRNKFLEKMLNMKSIPEITFLYKIDGRVVTLTNHEILQEFFNSASPNQLTQIQQMFATQKYNTQAINQFAKSAGNDFLNRKK